MAILPRRAVRSLLEDVSLDQLLLKRHFIPRLNALNDQSLATEWELIILSARSRVGLVDCEPRLDGPSNLDLKFVDAKGLRFIADITYLSDDAARRENPIDALVIGIRRVMAKERIKGDLLIDGLVGQNTKSGKSFLLIPMPHEFKKWILDKGFRQFLRAVSSSPSLQRSHSVDNEKAKLTITYRPSPRCITTINYPEFAMPRDITKNGLHNKLEAKLDQIKKIKGSGEHGLRGAVICDGGSSLFLRSHTAYRAFGFEQIASHFLKSTTSMDFVAAVAVRERRSRNDDDLGPYEFDVRVVDTVSGAYDGIVGSVFREGLRNIPRPIRTPVNARLDLARKRDRGLTELDFSDTVGMTSAHCQMTISARAAVDYLAGRIDRERFEILIDPRALALLKQDLEKGGLASSISLFRRDDRDDDELRLQWQVPDETVSPLSA